MKTKIKYTHIQSTSEIEKILKSRLEHIEKLIDPSDESALALIEIGKITEHHKSGNIYRAEINLHIARGDFYAFSENIDLLTAIDNMRDEIIKELHSFKDKKMSKQREGGREVKNFIKEVDREIKNKRGGI